MKIAIAEGKHDISLVPGASLSPRGDEGNAQDEKDETEE
jgi:hypothetical protein